MAAVTRLGVSGFPRSAQSFGPKSFVRGQWIVWNEELQAWMMTAPDSDGVVKYLGSAGYLSGGEVTKPGGAFVDVAAGEGFFRTADNPLASLVHLAWPASTGIAVPIPSIRYIGVEYNSGAPQVVIRTTDDWNRNTDWSLADIVGESDGTIHVSEHRDHAGDVPSLLGEYLHAKYHIQRASGLELSELGTRNITVAQGLLFMALSSYSIPLFDSTGADRFALYYGSFTKVADQSQWPNTQYDLSGTLTDMTPNRWAALYVYVQTDGHFAFVYGKAQYVTEAQAELDPRPTSLPSPLAEHGVYIARLIFKKEAATATITNPFIVPPTQTAGSGDVTAAATLTANAAVIGAGSKGVATIALPAAGEHLVASGASGAPEWQEQVHIGTSPPAAPTKVPLWLDTTGF